MASYALTNLNTRDDSSARWLPDMSQLARVLEKRVSSSSPALVRSQPFPVCHIYTVPDTGRATDGKLSVMFVVFLKKGWPQLLLTRMLLL